MNLFEHNGQKVVKASEIHQMLGIKKKFNDWIKVNIKRALIQEDKDYYPSRGISEAGRQFTDYYLNENAAISFCIMSGGQNAANIRNAIIDLFQRHKGGTAFTVEQIYSIIDLAKSLTLRSNRKQAERMHFEQHNNRSDWWQHRAKMLNYSTAELQNAVEQVNKKHESIEKTLMRLNPVELIRHGAVELFLALGKTAEYSNNVGEVVTRFANEMKLDTQLWDDTKPDPIGIMSPVVSERKQLMQKVIDSKKLTT